MRKLLEGLKGAKLIAQAKDGQDYIYHYLMTNGNIIEVQISS